MKFLSSILILLTATSTASGLHASEFELTEKVHQPEKEHLSMSKNTPIKSENCDPADCTKNEVVKPLQSTVQPEKQHTESPTTIHTLSGQQKMTEEKPPQFKPSEKNEVPKVDERSAITNCTYKPEMTSTKQTASPTKATTTPKVETTSVPSSCTRVWPKCMKDQLDTTFNETVADMMTFTLNLFQKISSRDSRPNLVISPISVALVLSQLMLGADGKTKEVLLSTLYKGVKDHDCIHNALQSLTINDAFLSASEIFYNKELHINNEFLNQSLRFYNTKGKPLSKNEKEGLETINSWISSKTNKLIPLLLQELPPDLQLLLVNVLYYQGKWVSQFDPNHTKKETFHRSSSDSVKVRMMNAHKYPLQSLRVSYLHAQVARFPLTDNSSLLIFLPISQDPSALNKMEKKLNQEFVEDLIKQLEEMQPRATSVSLPQLKLDNSIDLIEPLRLLDNDGLYYLFDDPNLCALSNNTSLAISDIRHRVVLEVKEEGVKTAVATTVSVARTITVFAVRRPFLFILVSGKSRVPILIGHVNDPSQ
ncbi:plasma protease C1 inhibitor isoform X2 [Hyperolius riggenbachi]|uniref:plasma protease C1 inhibitor isoform X2 n=1 Tax=Hyperolius riggenbachi TaxID=752182 RepID=UPI0035A3A762